MKYSSQIKPISYLKANAAELVRQMAERREPLIITQNGVPKAVIQDVASYEETEETITLLKILALGNRQIEKARSCRPPIPSSVCARATGTTNALRGAAYRGREA